MSARGRRLSGRVPSSRRAIVARPNARVLPEPVRPVRAHRARRGRRGSSPPGSGTGRRCRRGRAAPRAAPGHRGRRSRCRRSPHAGRRRSRCMPSTCPPRRARPRPPRTTSDGRRRRGAPRGRRGGRRDGPCRGRSGPGSRRGRHDGRCHRGTRHGRHDDRRGPHCALSARRCHRGSDRGRPGAPRHGRAPVRVPSLVAVAAHRVGHPRLAVAHRALAALAARALVVGAVHVALLARVGDPALRTLTAGVVARRTARAALAAWVLAVPARRALGARALGVALARVRAHCALGCAPRAVGLPAMGLLGSLAGLALLGSGPAGLLRPGCLLGHGGVHLCFVIERLETDTSSAGGERASKTSLGLGGRCGRIDGGCHRRTGWDGRGHAL